MLLSRKNFISNSSFLTALTLQQAYAMEPIQRIHPRIKGLSLAAYSMRSEMKWFKGKNGDGNMDMLKFLEFTAKHQFDAAELTAYFFPEPMSKSYSNEVKRRAHLLGLDLSGGAIGNNFCFEPKSDKGQEQLEYTKKWIQHYADMGIPVMRIFAGRPPKGMSEDVMMNNVRNNLNEVLKVAEAHGVILGMENHDSMTYVDKLLNFVKTVESPYFGITWDTANITTDGDPYHELAKIAPYTVNAQVKVKIPHGGQKVDTDFSKVLSILNQAKYAGYLTLEYEEKEDPRQEIPKFKKILANHLKA